jgi:elongation of very long chain fatty acids protein 4
MTLRFHEQPWMQALVSPAVWLVLPALWVMGVMGLVRIMTTKKPVDVKVAMQVYNVVQIVVCGYMVWGMLPCIGFPNIFGLNSEFDERAEWFVFVHYLSKYLDWFDTLWIILNKKRTQLSFLHVYHHATIVPVWGLLLQQGVGCGTIRYGAWINSLTHVIMYSHYLWTSLGLKNPFKRYITMWQMTQFYSCIVHAFVVLFFEQSEVQNYAWIQVVYQSTMVYLFGRMMTWVPECIPEFSAEKDETPISVSKFLSLLLA